MQLKTEIKEYLQQETNDLYDGFCLDLEKLCNRLGLGCFEAIFDNEKVSGAILKNDSGDGFTIYVNQNHHPNRKRFTVAHECGHYISYKFNSYSHEKLVINEGFEDYAVAWRHEEIHSDAETEANLIAAELLMPTEKIEELIGKNTSIEKMKQYFGVSEAAISIRLNTLGYSVVA